MNYSLWHHDEITFEDYIMCVGISLGELAARGQGEYSADAWLWVEDEAGLTVWECDPKGGGD